MEHLRVDIDSKAGVSYTYASGTHRATAAGSNTYGYDANGNMTGRTVSGTTYTLSYDYENRLTEVKIGAASQGTFVYDGDGVRVHTEVGPLPVDYVGSTYEHSNQTEDVPNQGVAPLGYGVNCYDSATGTGYLMYSAESVHERFAAYPPDANNADHFICVKYTGGVWKYDRGVSPYYYTFAPRPDDVLVAAIDFTNDTITNLEGTDTTENGIDKGYASGNLTYTADWWNGQVDDGEFTVGWQPNGQCNGACLTPNRLLTVRSYYYAGSTRVAMRDNGVVKYLFGDHLGSTSIVAKADGSLESWRLYKPWGETRYGTTPATTYGFTGQRQMGDIKSPFRVCLELRRAILSKRRMHLLLYG